MARDCPVDELCQSKDGPSSLVCSVLVVEMLYPEIRNRQISLSVNQGFLVYFELCIVW